MSDEQYMCLAMAFSAAVIGYLVGLVISDLPAIAAWIVVVFS